MFVCSRRMCGIKHHMYIPVARHPVIVYLYPLSPLHSLTCPFLLVNVYSYIYIYIVYLYACACFPVLHLARYKIHNQAAACVHICII